MRAAIPAVLLYVIGGGLGAETITLMPATGSTPEWVKGSADGMRKRLAAYGYKELTVTPIFAENGHRVEISFSGLVQPAMREKVERLAFLSGVDARILPAKKMTDREREQYGEPWMSPRPEPGESPVSCIRKMRAPPGARWHPTLDLFATGPEGRTLRAILANSRPAPTMEAPSARLSDIKPARLPEDVEIPFASAKPLLQATGHATVVVVVDGYAITSGTLILEEGAKPAESKARVNLGGDRVALLMAIAAAPLPVSLVSAEGR